MPEWILDTWNLFYTWATSQPTFIQVAIGNWLFFIALAFVCGILYLCTKVILRVIAVSFAFFSSSSLSFKLLIILAIIAFVTFWVYTFQLPSHFKR
jgi:hypothetical protein